MATAIVMWVVAAIALTGTFANIYKKWWGFVCWIISNSGLLVYSIANRQWHQVVLWSVYTMLAVWGLWSWTRSDDSPRGPLPGENGVMNS